MKFTYRDKEWTYDKSCTVDQLLKQLKVLPESVLVVCNGKLVTEDQRLPADAEIKVVSVISGG